MNDPMSILVDLVFPSRCVSCGAPLARDNYSVCGKCLSRIEPVEKGCEVCSGMVFDGKCEICEDRKYYPSANLVISEYSGVMKDMLHALKFERKRRLCVPMGMLAFRKISACGITADILTSVPMNRQKKRERGYNQSELVAKDIAARMKIPYRELLSEVRGAGTQRSMGYRDRFINVLGRYHSKKSETIKGKDILIIDDVFTTGATVNECARVLLDDGARSVFSLTFARAGIKRLEKNRLN